MSTVKFKNEIDVNLNGIMPSVGTVAPDFKGVKTDLNTFELSKTKGQKILLNIFPSVDTGVCAASVRKFNQEASSLNNTKVVCISKDLPFAQARFCGAEGIENIEMVSAFRCSCFEDKYGILQIDGPLSGLLARAVVVINENQEIVYTELVPEITQEPNYEMALKALEK